MTLRIMILSSLSYMWPEAKQKTIGSSTTWEFMPAGCQYRNRLAETWVKVVKMTLQHLLTNILIANKLTVDMPNFRCCSNKQQT